MNKLLKLKSFLSHFPTSHSLAIAFFTTVVGVVSLWPLKSEPIYIEIPVKITPDTSSNFEETKKIKLPTSEFYTVKAGDTLSGLFLLAA